MQDCECGEAFGKGREGGQRHRQRLDVPGDPKLRRFEGSFKQVGCFSKHTPIKSYEAMVMGPTHVQEHGQKRHFDCQDFEMGREEWLICTVCGIITESFMKLYSTVVPQHANL